MKEHLVTVQHHNIVSETEVFYRLPHIAVKLACHVSHSPAQLLRLRLCTACHKAVGDVAVAPVCEFFGISGYAEHPDRIMVELG